jgi:hypothetical protein
MKLDIQTMTDDIKDLKTDVRSMKKDMLAIKIHGLKVRSSSADHLPAIDLTIDFQSPTWGWETRTVRPSPQFQGSHAIRGALPPR